MKRRDERIVLIVIYVDELIDIAANDANIDEVKLLLKHKFEIKDLGELCYFMGIEVIRFQVGYSYCKVSMGWIYCPNMG